MQKNENKNSKNSKHNERTLLWSVDEMAIRISAVSVNGTINY